MSGPIVPISLLVELGREIRVIPYFSYLNLSIAAGSVTTFSRESFHVSLVYSVAVSKAHGIY